MNNHAVAKPASERISLPNIGTLLKISLGLVLFTLLSFALVYAETIPVDGMAYDVEYAATGMTVSAVEADLDFVSLIVTVDVTGSPGILDITLDRTFFDSTFNGLDDDFIILADGDEPTFTETASNSQSRTLRIELPSGTEEVEIIGSTFGSSIILSEEPTVEEPTVEEPTVEEPTVEEPTVEEPTVEEPTVEDKLVVTTPAVEDKPVVITPKVQCGPGTILKDGACVLDQRCGPGTILKDGACVLDSTPKPASVKGIGKELVMGVVAAFVVAGTIGLILGIMSKASKSS